jgi:hypothetical protein
LSFSLAWTDDAMDGADALLTAVDIVVEAVVAAADVIAATYDDDAFDPPLSGGRTSLIMRTGSGLVSPPPPPPLPPPRMYSPLLLIASDPAPSIVGAKGGVPATLAAALSLKAVGFIFPPPPPPAADPAVLLPLTLPSRGRWPSLAEAAAKGIGGGGSAALGRVISPFAFEPEFVVVGCGVGIIVEAARD